MSLFSFFRKNKQETAADDSVFYSRAETDHQTVRPRKRKASPRVVVDGETHVRVDPVLPEKKRARRRLVGAVALVLAVVIGLPMVLDSEPKPLQDDVAIEIPSKELPASGKAAAKPPARKGDAPAGSRVPPGAALDQKEEMLDLPTDQPAPKTAARKQGDQSAVRNPAGATRSKTEVAANEPVEKVVEKPTAKAAPENDANADTGGKQQKFTVQVAAFSSMDKVNELRGKLKEAGIASYTQRVATEKGERIRIRIGPLDSRQDADKIRSRLTALGLNGTLLPPAS